LTPFVKTKEQKELLDEINAAKKVLDSNNLKLKSLKTEQKAIINKTNKEMDKARKKYKGEILGGKIKSLTMIQNQELLKLKKYYVQLPILTNALVNKYEDMRNELINMIGNKNIQQKYKEILTADEAKAQLKKDGFKVEEWI